MDDVGGETATLTKGDRPPRDASGQRKLLSFILAMERKIHPRAAKMEIAFR
jgi:hypothetical protein